MLLQRPRGPLSKPLTCPAETKDRDTIDCSDHFKIALMREMLLEEGNVAATQRTALRRGN